MRKFIFIFLALFIFIAPGLYSYAEGEVEFADTGRAELIKAKVLEVQHLEPDEDNPIFTESMIVTVEILNGEFKGQIFETYHNLTGNFSYDIDVEPGDKVLVLVEKLEDGSVEVYISEYLRDTYIYIVGAIFIALILIIGKTKGLKTIITLMITLFLIIKGLLPGLLAGYSPILLSVGIAFIITIITLFTIGGFTRKSYAAVIGVLGGVFAAGLIAYIIGSQVKLTGLSSEEAVMLMYIPQGIQFDFKGLLFAGIILGALGAVMDVGMSISSSMEEIRNADPTMSKKDLIMSGMNVGKDIMGTMANTLILAYTGSSIPLLLLFTAYGEDFTKIINLDIIATEIIRAFSGSIGLILCIPLTALAAGILTKENRNTEENISDTNKI